MNICSSFLLHHQAFDAYCDLHTVVWCVHFFFHHLNISSAEQDIYFVDHSYFVDNFSSTKLEILLNIPDDSLTTNHIINCSGRLINNPKHLFNKYCTSLWCWIFPLLCQMRNTVKKTLLLIQGFERAPAYLTLTPKGEKVIDSVSTDKMPPVIFSDISLCWK